MKIIKNIVLGFILIVLSISFSGCGSKNKTANSIDISELLGQPISIAVEKFGEYSDTYDNIGSPICKFSDGLVMTRSNGIISSVEVDFSNITSKTKYNFKGIDGNSTKNDVIKILGEPEDLRFTTDTYKRYPIDNKEFNVSYSDDGLVIRFEYEMD